MKINTQQSVEALRMGIAIAEHEKADAVIEKMAQSFWPMIGTANQAAYMAIDDAVEKMRECGMLRQQAKVHAQQALKHYQAYEKAAYDHYHQIGDDRYGLWQDLVGRAALKLQPDIMRMYFAIKNVIDRAGVGNSDALAQIQTGVALITTATMMFNTMVEQFQRLTTMPIRRHFIGGRLTAVESHWKMVGEVTGRQVMKDVNLRDDPACQMGIKVLLNRYADATFLNESAGEAIRINPAIWHHLDEKEREEMNLNIESV